MGHSEAGSSQDWSDAPVFLLLESSTFLTSPRIPVRYYPSGMENQPGSSAAQHAVADAPQTACSSQEQLGAEPESEERRLERQHAFLDAAKAFDFHAVCEMATATPALINVQPCGRWSALHQAYAADDVGMVHWLLERGADASARNGDGHRPDEVAPPPSLERQHAFLDAAKAFDFHAVREMATATPALINVQPCGRWSALQQARHKADREMERWLIARGACSKVESGGALQTSLKRPSSPQDAASASLSSKASRRPPLPLTGAVSATLRPVVIIDGLNVARSYDVGYRCPLEHDYTHDHLTGHARPPACARAIVAVISYWQDLGYPVDAFVPQWATRGGSQQVHEPDLLEGFVREGLLHLCPSGCDEDRFIIDWAQDKLAAGTSAVVVSNDQYRNHVATRIIGPDWVSQHCIKFMFVGGEFRPFRQP